MKELNEIEQLFSGKFEVELTDDLIKKLVNEGLWGDEESLREYRKEGAKWNTARNSVTYPIQFG